MLEPLTQKTGSRWLQGCYADKDGLVVNDLTTL